MSKTVAVTGGRGFIGSAVVRLLEERGHKPIVLDRPYCDILDPCGLEDIASVDAVIHLAGILGTSELWQEADQAIDINIKGTLNVLKACRDAGASYVGITLPDVWPNIYAATKAAALRIALGFHHDDGVPVTHIRAFNAYGIGQKYGDGHPQKIIPTFASRLLNDEPIPIWGDGEQTVDLVHVDHVAECLVGACFVPGTGQTWDAGSGHERTVIEVAEMVARAADRPLKVEYLPLRRGELPHTRLCATAPPPWCMFDHYDEARFVEAVESYRP